MTDASAITALLGPTNTGKTHRAVQRMLEHRTGMIGLPLRLLAREVYEKVSRQVGEGAVALITGEEVRAPPKPDYWVCTVEAMPAAREVDFVAVDEVQLAAREPRGHVFTSRLLRARGRLETWFLGAGTMRKALSALVPTAQVRDHPRLSQLTFAGSAPLARLPPRSAVVAFSMPHVYALGERLRARKGGVAVVLGALSPRTRNAQVAMFQAGEVDYLVATDAVGMGLNLDCGHLAFASLRKFDGREARPLEDAELGQIAGRAGRWIDDGTFGTLEPLTMPPETARAIETHSFEPVRRLRYRSDDLDFSSVEALVASLDVPPPRWAGGLLRPAGNAEDRQALGLLLRDEEVRALARGEERVRLLWDVCTVPDFRKLLAEAHAGLLGELYVELARCGRLSDDWLRSRVRGLDDTSGDVEVLVARIAATRTWTYVSQRGAWLASPAEWVEATHALEDRLSDALHARLVQRFVGARAGATKARGARARSRPAASSAPREDLSWEPPEAGHPFAKLVTLRARLAPPAAPSARSLAASAWVEAVIEAPHADFRLGPDRCILHVPSGRRVGALVRGKSLVLPDVKLDEGGAPGGPPEEALGAGARSRLQRRLLAVARDAANALAGGLRGSALLASSTPELRAFVHRLEQGLGTVSLASAEAAAVARALGDGDLRALGEAGVQLGEGVAYVPSGLRREAWDSRRGLALAFFGEAAGPGAGFRGPGAVSYPAPRSAQASALCEALGFPRFGPRAVRADVAERTWKALRAEGGPPEGQVLASWLGCSLREGAAVAAAMVPGGGSAGGCAAQASGAVSSP